MASGIAFFVVLVAVVVLGVVAAPPSFPPVINSGAQYSAQFDANGDWIVVEGCSSSSIACATLTDNYLTTGWYVLDLSTASSFSDDIQSYGAGYLEGVLTQPLIWDAWTNFANGTTYNFTAPFYDFMKNNDHWVRTTAASYLKDERKRREASSTEVTYWTQVSLVLSQFDGLYDGYSVVAPKEESLSYDEFLVYQLSYEIGDIAIAVSDMDAKTRQFDQHCSVLIKPSADGQSLFASHDTWDVFQAMLRIYKHYDIQLSSSNVTGVSFSSYPGIIPSGDDFYITSANLAVVETTNAVFNNTLYTTYTTTDTVPYWIRVIVANRLGTNGQDWLTVFAMYNSGTYNNQWMITDFKLFTPGSPLVPNTLWVGEQVPGYFESADQTSFVVETSCFLNSLEQNISGYEAMYEQQGNEWSWSMCARAQIFRRDQGAVQTMADMQRIMRYNEYQTDPLSLQDACRGISARCDLNPPWAVNPLNSYSAFGGIDSKITNNLLAPSRTAAAVAGPTWDSQAPFAWTNQWANVPHNGHAQVLAFDWTLQAPIQP